MKTALYAAAAVAALSAPCAAWAAQGMVPPEVEGVVVTANRAPQRIDSVGGQITLIGPDAIRQSQSVILSSLLAQTPGVALSRNGGVGGATQLRIRGAESDQTVVLIDGVKLNDPSSTGGGYNFANLLVGDVSRIEVLRGAQSVLWGSQALGGVINILTADPAQPFEADVQAEVGSDNTGYLRAGLGGKAEHLVWRLSAAQFATDGVSTFAQSRGGAETDPYRNTGLAGKARVLLNPALFVDLRAVYSKGRNDFDGFPAPLYVFADTHEYGDTTDLVAYAGLNLDLAGGRFRNRLAYAYTGTDRENFNPQQAVTTRTYDSTGRNRRWEYQGTLQLAPAWSAVVGAETERSTFRAASPSSFAPNPPAARAKADLTGVYAQVVGHALPGLTLAAGIRRDDHQTFGTSTVGQASAAWTPNAGATVLRASWGQGFKAPTLYQLYSDYGNTRLAPEEADSWDAGVEQKLQGGKLVFQAAYFERRTTNLIDFVSCAAGAPAAACASPTGGFRFGYYANTSRSLAHGVELQAQARIAERLTVSGNYSWTDTENTSPGSANRGKTLARRPDNLANLEAAYRWPAGLTTTVALRYAGDSFDDAANLNRNKGYALVDLRAAYPVSERLEVYGRVENLTNERYETTRNYGQPGRSAAMGLRARF